MKTFSIRGILFALITLAVTTAMNSPALAKRKQGPITSISKHYFPTEVSNVSSALNVQALEICIAQGFDSYEQKNLADTGGFLGPMTLTFQCVSDSTSENDTLENLDLDAKTDAE